MHQKRTRLFIILKFSRGACNCQSSTRAVRVLDGSQQKADVVKTDYSDSLLMITRLKTRMIITIRAAHITSFYNISLLL